MAATIFRDWLMVEMKRQQISRRGLARKLAEQHPQGVNDSTVETYRRAIYKYLDPVSPTRPTDGTRAAFAEVLGVEPDEVPGSDDDEEDDLMAPLLREMQRLSKKIERLGEVQA